VSSAVDGYPNLNHRKILRKTQRSNNLLKTKNILKPKYKPSGDPFLLYISLARGGGSHPCPQSVTPLITTYSLCTPFWVSRVVTGAHLRLIAPRTTPLLSWWMLHWWQTSGSTQREAFPCTTHPRGWAVCEYRFSSLPHDPTGNRCAYQLWWRALSPLYHLRKSWTQFSISWFFKN